MGLRAPNGRNVQLSRRDPALRGRLPHRCRAVIADNAGVRRRSLRRGAALLLAVSAGLPLACGSSSAQGTNGREIRDVDPTAIPATVVDLNVVHENIRSTVVKGVDTYLAA